MDAAKNAVKNIISRGGHHDTTVEESVNPAVTSETIKPHRHEETTQAIDREVHQDHYHTTVQPLQHKEVLPEKHTHQQMPVQEKEFHHGDSTGIRSNVEAEAAQFQSTSRVLPTTESTAQAAAATGEHVHHHVHETVQPVIHKETVQPEVVHTTIPIHETHHAQAEHHGMSTLPTKTLAEFKELGGKITGASHRHEEYEGHPRPYNPEMQNSRGAADLNPEAHDGLHGSHGRGTESTGLTGHHTSHTGTGATSGLTGTSGTSGLTGTSETSGLRGTSGTSGLTGTHGTHSTHGTHGTHGTGTNVSGVGNTGSDYNTGSGYTSGGVGSTGTALGGRTEGNTAGRALEAVTGHGHGHTGHSTVGHSSSGTTGTSGIGSETGRGLGDSTTGHSSTGGTGTHHNTGYTDTSSSNTANTGNTGVVRDDVQTPRQGKDPNLVETETGTSGGSGLKGEGVPGSHSAVFGLTPDGQKYDDTRHSSTSLRPAHSSKLGESTSGDTGSRAPTGQGIAQQLNDPRVNERSEAGAGAGLSSSVGSGKPGAGTSSGASQGFGQVRPEEHGGSAKMTNKLDPTTDADGDGKRGFMD